MRKKKKTTTGTKSLLFVPLGNPPQRGSGPFSYVVTKAQISFQNKFEYLIGSGDSVSIDASTVDVFRVNADLLGWHYSHASLFVCIITQPAARQFHRWTECRIGLWRTLEGIRNGKTVAFCVFGVAAHLP